MFTNYFKPSHDITPLTFAVIAHQDKNGKFIAKIIEDQAEFIVDYTPTKVIDYACAFFGADLEGRQAGTREVCGITHKSPICIDTFSGMYFFPTSSPANPHCSWIAHSHIREVNRAENQSTEIIFKGGRKLLLEISYGSMINQVHRTAQYRYLLDHRIKYLQSYRDRKNRFDRVAEPSLKDRE